MCDVLRDWPHLLKLFMGFVGPVDAIEANVVRYCAGLFDIDIYSLELHVSVRRQV